MSIHITNAFANLVQVSKGVSVVSFSVSIAVKNGMENSALTSAKYTISEATPTKYAVTVTNVQAVENMLKMRP